ncbi:MAG: transglutaminase-like domain-containing protein [archaeon]
MAPKKKNVKAAVILFCITAAIFLFIGFMAWKQNQEENQKQKQEEMQNAVNIEISSEFTESHQVNQSFSIFNPESNALTNVVVEAYLLDQDQDPSQEFVYMEHKQIKIGIVNPGEKTGDYSILMGQESPTSDYSAYIYLKATSAEGYGGSISTYAFNVAAYSVGEDYRKTYCSKIDPYNLEVRKATSEAVKAHPGSFGIDQLLDIYDWVKANINYLNVPVTMPITPYSTTETLATKSGDCKNQAVLIASMVEAIGGEARVVVQPSCEHAYTIVKFINTSLDIRSDVVTILNHYYPCRTAGFICEGKCWSYPPDKGVWCDENTAVQSDNCAWGQVGYTDNLCHSCNTGQTLILEDGKVTCRNNPELSVNWIYYLNERWIIFDPAGGEYPGNTIPECLAKDPERYFIYSCVEPPK